MPHVLGPDETAAGALDEIMQHLVVGIEGGKWVPDPMWEYNAKPDAYSHLFNCARLCTMGVGLAYIGEDGNVQQSHTSQGGMVELGVYHLTRDAQRWDRHVFMMSNRTTEYLFVLDREAGEALLTAYHKVLMRLQKLELLKEKD